MIFIYLYKYFFGFLYFFIKLFKVQDKIVLISRFHKTTSIDFSLLEKDLKKEYKKVKILNHKTKNPFKLFYYSLVQIIHVGTSKGVIIDSYIPTISMLKHRDDLVIIQIWHASGAIKKFGHAAFGKKDGRNRKLAKHINMHGNYDYVISGGLGSISHFAEGFNVDKKRVKAYGLPKMSFITDEDKIKNAKEEVKEILKLDNKKNIIYAPTFRKENNIQYDELIKHIDLNKFNLIIKKHPNDNSPITNRENVIIEKDISVFKLFSVADYIITDYSALSIDASILNIPLFFFLYDIEDYYDERGLNIDFKKDYPKISFYKADELESLLKKEYDYKSLQNFNENFVSKEYKNSSKNIIKLLKEMK